MSRKKIVKSKFITSSKVEILVVLIIISSIAVHGYVNHQDVVDNEKLKIETSVNDKITPINKNATTTIPILVYHKVGQLETSNASNTQKYSRKFDVQVDVFENQMKYIVEQGYTPLTIQELITKEKSNTLPTKPIVITFDDGWRSQYENALPILVKYHINGTFYIYTGVIGSPFYMTWDDLNDLVKSNMEIGDHTKTHPRLTKIDPSKLDDELVKSKNTLEKNLHVSVTDFAYPYGDYNSKIVQAVKDAGYTSARTSNKVKYNDFKDLYKLNVLYAPSDLQTLKDLLSTKS
jgi:peptidoglycan/xylan/chitin deacetylase (PgdA/CDA1 family)